MRDTIYRNSPMIGRYRRCRRHRRRWTEAASASGCFVPGNRWERRLGHSMTSECEAPPCVSSVCACVCSSRAGARQTWRLSEAKSRSNHRKLISQLWSVRIRSERKTVARRGSRPIRKVWSDWRELSTPPTETWTGIRYRKRLSSTGRCDSRNRRV